MNRAPAPGRILVVDDDAAIRTLLQALLRSRGYEVAVAADCEQALEVLARQSFELVLLDLHLPKKTGVEVLADAHAMHVDAEFILMTAHASVDTAIAAMKHGARDYLVKPLSTDALLPVVRQAVDDALRRREAASLKHHRADDARTRMIGKTPAMQALWERIERVAPTKSTVLITGETGTGKELVARAIHELSPRAAQRFVAANCSALPETLLESELFGHVKGSFTGAIGARKGLFEEASGGTFFLDEISTVTRGIQITLLRVIQERVIQRIGSNTPIPVDVRLLAATNTDLGLEVAAGRFRADLFYRLNVVQIFVPPLRARRDDIALLARHFLRQKAEEMDLVAPPLPAETIRAMEAYDWPGNVRELENFIEGALISFADGMPIVFNGPEAPAATESGELRISSKPLPQSRWRLAEREREQILQALAESGGNRGRAARMLGIDRRTLYRKLKEYREQGAGVGGPAPSPAETRRRHGE